MSESFLQTPQRCQRSLHQSTNYGSRQVEWEDSNSLASPPDGSAGRREGSSRIPPQNLSSSSWTKPPTQQQTGVLSVDIDYASVKPAEFIVISLEQEIGKEEVSLGSLKQVRGRWPRPSEFIIIALEQRHETN